MGEQNDKKRINRSGRPNRQGKRRKVLREQPAKDSRTKRVNFDNMRVTDAAKALDSMSNDVGWYTRSKEIALAASTIGFSQVTGLADGNNIVYPGMMVIPWITSLGGAANPSIKQAADEIYSYVVHKNSRNTSYTSADMMSLILGAKEAYNAIAVLIRIYGAMLDYNSLNRYQPKAVVEGSGCKFSTAIQSYHKMAFDINLLIAKIKQIWIPNTMPVFEREFWMCSHVYMDADTPKAQFYMYTPYAVRIYNETADDQGAILNPVLWLPDISQRPNETGFTASLKTWDQLVTLVDSLITALVDSEDRGLICGDMLKAYGEENLYRVNFMDIAYSLSPVYDPEVLEQMSNTTFCRPMPLLQLPVFRRFINANRILEAVNPNYTPTSTPNLPQGVNMRIESPLLNMHLSPTPENVMVATRMMARGNVFRTTNNVVATVIPEYCGTEVAYWPIILYYDKGNSAEFTAVTVDANLASYTTLSKPVVKYKYFDWAPIIYLGSTVPTYGDNGSAIVNENIIDYLGDIQNAVVASDSINRMHIAAVLSEFGVPLNI